MQEENRNATNQLEAANKLSADRMRLLKLREEALGKWKDILRDEDHYEGVSAEEVYYWELEKMKVETLREIYRACTVSDTKADFNGVLKSVAQQVNKDDCMGRIVYYMVGVTKKDDMKIGGDEELMGMGTRRLRKRRMKL